MPTTMKPNEIHRRLEEQFPGADVLVTDLTGTEDHYEVRIIASQFEGLSRIQQHKTVMDVFGPELQSGEIHAFTIKTLAKG